MNRSQFNIVLFILLASFWGGSFIGIKAVITSWPPFFGAAVRVGIALLGFIFILLLTKRKTQIPFRKRWKIWMIGLFAQSIPFSFLFWGERLISPGLAGIINSTVSIWTLILSLIFFSETTSFTPAKLLGLIVGLSGILTIFWPIVSFDGSSSALMGACAVLMMAFSYAIGSILNQYFLKDSGIDFFTNIYHQHWASFASLFLLALIFEPWPSLSLLSASSVPWLASLYLGVFSTAIAYVIYYYLIREWDALHASTVLYVVPALALLWDFLIYGNCPTESEIVGVVAILAGVTLIQLANFRRMRIQAAV